jgi:hypothetical protein
MSKHIEDAVYEALEAIESDAEPQLCAGCLEPLGLPAMVTMCGPVYHLDCFVLAMVGRSDEGGLQWVN